MRERPTQQRWMRAAAVTVGLAVFLTALLLHSVRTVFDLLLSTVLAVTAAAITERFLQKLRGERSRLKAILSSMAEAVVTTDRSERITSVNPAGEQLIGAPAKRLVGRSVAEAFGLFDASGRPVSRSQRLLPRAIASRETVTTPDYGVSLERSDGARVPVSIVAAPILDHRGRLIGGVEIIRDVAREREVDQMKSALVSTVSHELRTPLTMILGFSELLATRDLGEQRSKDALAQIHDSADRLSRLIDDLLSVSRIESGKIEPRATALDLSFVVRRAVQPFAEEREIRLEAAEDLPLVSADPDMLAQILTNLVSNALKYSPAGAPVCVRTGAGETGVEIEVADRGIGMSEQTRAKVFDKFFRADQAEVHQVSGTGLGLYITKQLVELQGGRIWIRSEPGAGSTFGFSLPVASDLAAKEAS